MSVCWKGLVGYALPWIIGPRRELHLLTRHLCKHTHLTDAAVVLTFITRFKVRAGQDQADDP